jgi:hypothetical protein
MAAILIALICLCVFTIKSVAGSIKNIQPRQYQEVKPKWEKYEAPQEDYLRPVTKKEFAEAGLVSGYIDGNKYFCKIRNDEVVWCSYWETNG